MDQKKAKREKKYNFNKNSKNSRNLSADDYEKIMTKCLHYITTVFKNKRFTINQIRALFCGKQRPTKDAIYRALKTLELRNKIVCVEDNPSQKTGTFNLKRRKN